MLLSALLIILFQPVKASLPATPELQLEIGEEYLLPTNLKKIWIENKKFIEVISSNNRYKLKALSVGNTYFRLDNKLFKVSLLPLESKKIFSQWQKITQKFVGIKPQYCGVDICLIGSLYRLEDFKKLLLLMAADKSPIYLALEMDESLQTELQNFFSESLRKNGFTPLKIVFSQPWKVLSAPNQIRASEQDYLQRFGVKIDRSAENTAVADNIKVAVKIVEINKNYEKKLGVRWPDSFEAQVLNSSKIESPAALDIAISLAEKNGEARVLASPNLICRSGKEAHFFAGGEFPIKVINLKSKEIIWKKYGIDLKFRPLIDAAGQMSLQIESEVSSINRSITIDDIPALLSHHVSSYFDLINSKTVAISGLLKTENSESAEGVPYLNNIPILGSLFKSKNFIENKSELMIFVTPELVP